MHNKKIHVALLLVLSMLVSAAAFAQTSETGAITGRVTQAGNPLPGVTVEIRAPELQGTKTDVTDTKGMFRFSVLPPGTYSLTATLSGFSPARQNNIAVGLSRTVTLDITLSPAVSERITVTGAAPVVDITSPATSGRLGMLSPVGKLQRYSPRASSAWSRLSVAPKYRRFRAASQPGGP